MADESQVSMFYAFKKILITGGTGFMGKVLLWKLLHSCSKLDTIYVLMRSKHGKSPMSRKEEFFKAPIFNNFKQNNPKVLEKVVLICGDVGEDGIGLSDEDRNMLVNEVSIVFHGAAILKMNANLRTAVNVNTVGTVRMLDMAQQMKKLEAFVYISTAYCCCELSTVEERIYSSKHNPYDIINLIRWMDPELLKKITPKLIHPSPNTYIYSKRITESLLENYASEVPIIVARPSIVVSSFKEPLPGWGDTLNGPAGFFAAAGRGLLRTTMMNIDTKSEIIPADIVINSILLLSWANSREQLLNKISVYNITQNSHENLTWRRIRDYFLNSFEKYPPNMLLWYPNTDSATKNTFVYTIKCIFLHYLPAYIIDFILLLGGQKPFLVRVHDKIRQGEKLLAYFTQRQWTFVHDKLLQLEQLLNDTDKQLFIINMKTISDVQSYADDVVLVSKKYMFNEDIKTIDTAKRTVKIMYVVDKITLALRYYFLWKIFMFIFNVLLSIYA